MALAVYINSPKQKMIQLKGLGDFSKAPVIA